MTLTGKETNYYIARKNTNSNEDSILRFNSYNGMFSVVQDLMERLNTTRLMK